MAMRGFRRARTAAGNGPVKRSNSLSMLRRTSLQENDGRRRSSVPSPNGPGVVTGPPVPPVPPPASALRAASEERAMGQVRTANIAVVDLRRRARESSLPARSGAEQRTSQAEADVQHITTQAPRNAFMGDRGARESADSGSGPMMRRHATTVGPRVTRNLRSSTTIFGGATERMEPTKWDRWSKMVDKNVLGAHYDYIVGELASVHHKADDDRALHDALLADGLHKRRPSEVPMATALLGEETDEVAAASRRPMVAAFTDRSVRLREGRGARSALMPKEDSKPYSIEWLDYRSSGSYDAPAVEECGPAGQASHLVHYNRPPRCGRDSAPAPPYWQPEVSSTFHSKQMGETLTHVATDELPAEDELAFTKHLGRKAKCLWTSPGGGKMLEHRSMVQDDRIPAGNYDQEGAAEISLSRGRSRQAFQASIGDEPPRAGVAMVLCPQPGDPPPPSRIVAFSKGKGLFADGYSRETHDNSVRHNEQMYRFAGDRTPRSRSVPPELLCGAAGVPSARLVGGTAMDRHHTPRRGPPGGNWSNTSHHMSRALDVDGGEAASARERSARRAMDKPFADLCAYTDRTKKDLVERSGAIIAELGRTQSHNVANTLVWGME